MKKLFTLVMLFVATSLQAQESIDKLPWPQVALQMSESWYATEQAAEVAQKVLSYQTEKGGWPKNQKFHSKVDEKYMREVKESGIGATIDNEATTTEMRFFAKMYKATKNKEYKTAFLKGLDYLFEAQYDNGGWPQFYPYRSSTPYSRCITYNDGAYVNVMNLLADIYNEDESFAALKLSRKTKKAAKESFDKGVDCILKTQIVVNGELTVWCAQHDQNTLAPAAARAYELVSFSGGESAEIVKLLMSLPSPSPEIVASIKGAVKWFDESKIVDRKRVVFIADNGEKDSRLEYSKGHNLWARFYDIETNKPFFCDRDGIKKATLEEIGQERRGGYAWYRTEPNAILKAYPKWLKDNNL